MRSTSTVKLLLVMFGAGVLLALIALFAIAKPLLRSVIERRAAEHGVALELSDIDFGFSWVGFSDAKFHLIGVHELGGTLKRARVTVRGLEPESIELTGADVRVVGSLSNLALEMSRWTSAHPETYRLPVTASAVRLTWQDNMAEAPWLVLTNASVTPTPGGRSLLAERATAVGRDLGKIGAAWTGKESLVSIGLGAADVASAPITVRIEIGSASKAQFRLAPTSLETLSRAFGMKPLPADIFAQGTLDLSLPPLGQPSKIPGKLAVQLKGFVPPHPPELDGFVFGDTTTFVSDIEIAADYARGTLTNASVVAGAFRLAGDGTLSRVQDHVRVQLTLRGALPCGALAGAALTTRLGKTIGPFLARGAREFLSGSVAVTVRIDAETRDVAAARVSRAVGIGCGLKPLKVPRELEELLKRPLPPLPSSLPPLPSSLPPWPALPKLPIVTPPAQ
jgi:hypothetical protein